MTDPVSPYAEPSSDVMDDLRAVQRGYMEGDVAAPLVDVETGEVRRSDENYNDEQIAEMVLHARTECDQWRLRRDMLESILFKRMQQRGALAVPSSTFKIELQSSAGKPVVDYPDKLHAQLEGLVPAAELNKSVYKVVTPFWKSNVAELKKLARYGDHVRAIIERAITRSAPSPKLVIERREAS